MKNEKTEKKKTKKCIDYEQFKEQQKKVNKLCKKYKKLLAENEEIKNDIKNLQNELKNIKTISKTDVDMESELDLLEDDEVSLELEDKQYLLSENYSDDRFDTDLKQDYSSSKSKSKICYRIRSYIISCLTNCGYEIDTTNENDKLVKSRRKDVISLIEITDENVVFAFAKKAKNRRRYVKAVESLNNQYTDINFEYDKVKECVQVTFTLPLTSTKSDFKEYIEEVDSRFE